MLIRRGKFNDHCREMRRQQQLLQVRTSVRLQPIIFLIDQYVFPQKMSVNSEKIHYNVGAPEVTSADCINTFNTENEL